jgi:N-methylhydantoinase B
MKESVDPILLEVFINALVSVGEEMAAKMKRSARSIQGRSGDCSTILVDSGGEIIAQGQGAQFHMGYAKAVMPNVLKKWHGRLQDGDMIALNDPYQGLSHLPDIVLIAPVFWGGQIAAYATIVTHHSDIGGRFPGGQGIASEELYEEGLRLPNIKLYENGRLSEILMDVIAANVRAPDDVIGDIEGQVAACKSGVEGLHDLLDKYGIDTFEQCIAQLKAYSEQQMRTAIADIADGDYSCDEFFEENGRGGSGLNLRLTVKVRGEQLAADFTGTDPQVPSGINVPWGLTCSAVYLACRYMLAPNAFTNAGIFSPLEVIAPLGCLLNPRFPAAVGGRGMMLWRIVDMITVALGKACPQRALADGEGGPSSMTFIPTAYDTKVSVLVDFYMSGWGARTTKDGIDGANALALGGGPDGASVEIMETEYPILVEGHYFAPDTGGAGKYRGALSLCRKFRFLRPGRVMLRTSRSNSVPHGLGGGRDGTPFKAVLISKDRETELPRSMFIDATVEEGDVIMHMLPGAGGFGAPFERNPNLVLQDVVNEKISPSYARQAYGVVVDLEAQRVDSTATAVLRAGAKIPTSSR